MTTNTEVSTAISALDAIAMVERFRDPVIAYGRGRKLLEPRLALDHMADFRLWSDDEFDFKADCAEHAIVMAFRLAEVEDLIVPERAALNRFGPMYAALWGAGPSDALWPAPMPGAYRQEFNVWPDPQWQATDRLLRKFVDACDTLAVVCTWRVYDTGPVFEALLGSTREVSEVNRQLADDYAEKRLPF